MNPVNVKLCKYIAFGMKIVKSFSEKGLQRIYQTEVGVEKLIKRKRDKLYVKWKSYDNYFNSWIDKKDFFI